MKFYRLFIAAIVILAISGFGHTNTFAADKADALVNSAVKAGKTLDNMTTVGKKATGKNIPTKEYNAAVKKYKSAKSAVNKQSGKKKKANLSKLKTVNTQISRGKKYINAVSNGKKIASKKAKLDKDIKMGVINSKTLVAYSNLSKDLNKYASTFDTVYDKKTRDTVKKLYKTPAEKIKKDLNYAIIVKKAIDETSKLMKSNTSSNKLAVPYYTILLNIDSIPQQKMKQQLMKEVKKINSTIPSKLKTGKFAEYVNLEMNFERLDSYISKGKSNAKVPGLYNQLKKNITSISSKTDKARLQKRFAGIMNRQKVSIKELKGMLTKSAIAKGIPPEVVKSIAVTENGNLTQFLPNGEVFKSHDNGYGIMQVTPMSDSDKSYDWNRVKYDLSYNIQAGVEILAKKWTYAFLSSPVMPKINNGEKNLLENWYFAIMAYNGLSTKNDPNKVTKPYQLKVYENMKNRTLMNPEIVKKQDVIFTGNPVKLKTTPIKTKLKTKSTQFYKKNDRVTISASANFRTKPTTKSTRKSFPKGTKVTILGGAIEDDSPANLFTWYKVSVSGAKGTWYVASSNLK
ncbi:transglycosylase SLT domain-containing protein [Bacillus sporothermodurans]|uniref:transglycosylase SLT domain-containing protein n=1 Tax=Heyndrickxia sporothermodurans TaxID=46224 RepID=UPI00192BE874|nr:transglycosylase SLT domain-containing protein [Heyndrickxia sporothermodurans]MBL5813251.1 transglycosylase SLT domain-containing protein [Heyndrickxia sporothermodurans]